MLPIKTYGQRLNAGFLLGVNIKTISFQFTITLIDFMILQCRSFFLLSSYCEIIYLMWCSILFACLRILSWTRPQSPRLTTATRPPAAVQDDVDPAPRRSGLPTVKQGPRASLGAAVDPAVPAERRARSMARASPRRARGRARRERSTKETRSKVLGQGDKYEGAF